MRHFLFIGAYLEMETGSRNALGDMIELGQLAFPHAADSGLNWQDFFSNRFGSSFARYLMENNIDWENPEANIAEQKCLYIDSPIALNQRPIPNPDNC